jgi:hypothetical protein
MSHAGGFRTVVAVVVVASVVVSCNGGLHAQFDALVPDTDEVHINFSCGATNSIALADKNGGPAWSFQRKPNESITWVVPQAVTITSIASRPGDPPFPIGQGAGDPHGGSPGTPFKGKVKGGANGTYHYIITASCDPGGGAPPLNLSIDPEMIVR